MHGSAVPAETEPFPCAGACLSSAFRALVVPSACAPWEPVRCVQAAKGLFYTLGFWKETCLADPRLRHLWGRLVQATPCPATVTVHAEDDGIQQAADSLTLWPVLTLRRQLLPFAFSCAAPPACATKSTVFCPQSPSPAISTLFPLSLSPLLPFPPLLLNLYFFFSVPAKRYQSR